MSKKFEEKKNNFLEKLQEALNAYDELSKSVSPRNWRTTGHHFNEMKKIKEEAVELKEITSAERKLADLYE